LGIFIENPPLLAMCSTLENIKFPKTHEPAAKKPRRSLRRSQPAGSRRPFRHLPKLRCSGTGLMASRHALSDLLCSMLNQKQDGIEAMGLPSPDKTKAQAALKREDEAKAKNKLIQEANPVSSTLRGISVLDASISEGNSGTKNLSVTVKLSKSDRTKTISASFVTQDGTATAGSDYTTVKGTVTFAPGSTTRTVSVPITGDTTLEPNENFLLLLSNPVNGFISDGSATCTISNDETTPSSVPILNSLPGAVAVASSTWTAKWSQAPSG
jgi:hypothetical protein